MPRMEVATNLAPTAVGPYAQAKWAGDFLFISGQLGLDPGSGKLVNDSTADQARQALKNTQAILLAAKLDFKNIVKATVFLTDMRDFAAVNEVYASFFAEVIDLPARACVAVADLPRGGRVEIEAVAHKG